MPSCAVSAILLLLVVAFASSHTLRVKRQYDSSQQQQQQQSYPYQQWSGGDQGSYQQPSYGYRSSFAGSESYQPSNGGYYHNYYSQHQGAPQQGWNSAESGGGYGGYAHPDSYPSYNSGYGSQQTSGGYGAPRPASSYARPAGISGGESGKSNYNTADQYATPPAGWEKAASKGLPAKSGGPAINKARTLPMNPAAKSKVTFFEHEGVDENGEFVSHHGVEVTSEGGPTGFEEGSSMRVDGIDENVDGSNRTTISPATATSSEEITTIASEPPATDGSESTTSSESASVEEGPTTTPSAASDETATLFVDVEDPSLTWVTTTTITEQPPSAEADTVAVDEYIPTEVSPAASEHETSTSGGGNSSTSAKESDKSVLLRSPPLPMQVVEKLKELGFSVIKMFY